MRANEMSTVVPDEHIKAVCLIGQGEKCCRYLTAGHRGLECEKHTALKAALDARVAAGTFISRGDNCEGIRPGFQP